jgi:hypothetical protein
MPKRSSVFRASSGLVKTGAAAVASYLLLVRPWHLRWGAADDEVDRSLPGDEIVPHPPVQTTRAITIRAPAANIWPWLVQIGYNRAGWYSYDRLEAAMGAGDFVDGESADRIIPELQHLEIGDPVPAAPDVGWFVVAAIEPGHSLVLRATLNPFTGQAITADDAGPRFDGTWAFLLNELDNGTTRLIARLRATYEPRLPLAPLVHAVLEPAHFIMERKMLLGIKERAEGTAGGASPPGGGM